MKTRRKAPDVATLEWPLEPTPADSDVCSYLHWTSRCGRYRVTRSQSILDADKPVGFSAHVKAVQDWTDKPKWWGVERTDEGAGYVRYHRTLAAALTAAEKHLADRLCVPVTSNRKATEARAEELGVEARHRTDKTAKPKLTEAPAPEEPTPKQPRPKAAPAGGAMNILDAAAKVLAEEGGMLSAKELTALMIQRGYWSTPGKTPQNTVEARISTDMKTKGAASRFARPHRGKFVLNGSR